MACRDRFVALAFALSGMWACADGEADDAAAAAGAFEAPCAPIVVVADAGSLGSIHLGALPGDCVEVQAGRYDGSVQLRAGQTLFSRGGVTLVGPAGGVALTVPAGATALGLAIEGGATGVHVTGAGAKLHDLSVTGASELGVLVDGGGGCATAAIVTLERLTVTRSGAGLYARSGCVELRGGALTDNLLPGLLVAHGLIVATGAELSATGTEIARNEGAGVLVDGAGGTRVRLVDLRVNDNRERGIWAQGLQGEVSIDPVLPMLEIDGAATEILRNGFVGVGAIASRGLAVRAGRIEGTVGVEVIPPELGVATSIGDGVALLEGTSEVELSGLSLGGNPRAAVLIDRPGTGVRLRGLALDPATALGVVLQRSAVPVDVPAELLTETAELPVDARPLALP